ncbi:hypothetical protein [Paludibaculum fermentans]|uniref:Uncharacterized protein n=1 Tax=Paludibaculum fermentans TaxID=1473598 RepID=A0A7S7NMV3_PALFE|nr:hypothetical protein [Paludibaculum fermentans]QOY86537.1 hypothetical protein IRI77_27610 [Paludibaculum fermentans]
MSGFRKAFLLMAVLVLVTGIAFAQSTPLQCVANSGTTPPVRAEGVAEEVGQVIITCTGGTSTTANQPIPTFNVQIFLSTNVTSRLLGHTQAIDSEALLLIDEPAFCNNTTATVGCQLVASTVPNTQTVTASGSGLYYGGATGRPNVFVGQVVGTNSIAWLNIPFDPPGTTSNRVIRLANVRANANQLGVSSTLIPTSINMFISISGTGSLSLANSQLTVAYVQLGMKFSATPATYNQCEAGTKTFNIKFAEQFGTAFRKNIPATTPQATVGSIYNTESMFYNPNFAGTQAATAGLATQATRLIARFSNVPGNVALSVPLTITTADGDSATLVAAPTDGSTASTADGSVALSGGAGAAVWEVTASNSGAISTFTVPVSVAYKANPLPGLGTATVSGNYAPTTTVFTASASAPAPRFVDNPQSATTFTINSCRTNLLFPFVTNVSGFDTGLVISNTSSDPFGTVPQRGPCTLNYYGSTSGGGAAPGVQTSGTVNEGTQLIWTLSNGGNLGVAATPGFMGYIIAQCNFQFAHGYAFVSDLGASRVAEGYLALVMDKDMFNTGDGATRTGASSEKLVH